MTAVSIVALVLLICAVLVVAGAEWPRVSRKIGAGPVRRPHVPRRKRHLAVVPTKPDDEDDFAESVKRDLANLPVIEERDRK